MKLILLVVAFFAPQFSYGSSDLSGRVLVSIAPYKFFVDAIAGDTLKVDLIVPPYASFHTYEPTPKQMIEASQADVWFRIGESFEGRALKAMQSHHPQLKVVDLRSHVNLIVVDEHHSCKCCISEGADLHIWLSPRMAKNQVKQIADVLIETYPQHQELYAQRAQQVLTDLDALDAEIMALLAPLKNRVIMVAHPAYAYFARDYQLTQLPIEFEGKDPSPRQLTKLLDEAKKLQVKRIYTQNQYSTKGAELIAQQLHAQIVELNPYSGDYFTSLRTIAQRIAAQE